MKRYRKRSRVVAGLTIFAAAAAIAVPLAAADSAPPPPSVTLIAGPAQLSDSVQVNQDRIKFQTKDATQLVTQRFTFGPGASSGWHHHTGVIMVLVVSGTLTTHDANCQTTTYSAGQVFIESGTTPFMVTNDTGADAIDVGTQVAPAGAPFRINDSPPPCASS